HLRLERGDARARRIELAIGADRVLGLGSARTIELVATLGDQLLGLAHLRPFAAVLIDRYGRLQAHTVGVVLVVRHLQVELLLDKADQIDLRQQVADRAVDAVVGSRDAVLRADCTWPIVHGERNRLLFAARQSADQRHLAQPPRPLADGTLVARFGDADLGFGLHQVGAGAFETRLRLRDVGDGELADPEAFARRVE